MTINENGRNGETEGEGKAPVVALFPLKAIGHLQMFLPIVKELLERKAEVHMFLDNVGESKDSKGEQAIEALVKLGLKRYPLMSLLSEDSHSLAEIYFKKYRQLVLDDEITETPELLFSLGMQRANADLIPILISKLEVIKPDCILFDTFNLSAHAAGKIMKVPTIGYVSYPGPGCSDKAKEAKYLELFKPDKVKAYHRNIYKPLLEKYQVDIYEEIYGAPGPVFYSDHTNIVTTLEELAQRDSELHKIRLPTFKYIGPTFDETIRINTTALVLMKSPPKAEEEDQSSVKDRMKVNDCSPAKADHGDLPWQTIADAKLDGKKIICLSFGTVITNEAWANGFQKPPPKDQEEPKKKIHTVGGAQTGKELCQKLWKDLFEAFGEDPNVLFITSVGKQSDALEGEGLDVPSNFIIRQEIPQLKVLRQVDVFITHGGWNSLQESLLCGVPMLVLPGFGDQMNNARKMEEIGAGIGIIDSYSNASVDLLQSSLNQLLYKENFKSKAKAIGKKLRDANGAKKAADIVLEAACC